MPGSTATPSEEQTKAKVAEPTSTNGIFVRPVAVAGIFRPAEESTNKPPALPEKRRFSALSGDLRPCGSGDSNDDFARRRQSWDVKVKEVPFGQSLLRKTPRNSIASPRTSKQDLTSNGSSHEDISSSDGSLQVSEIKLVEKLNSKSEVVASSNTLASNSCTFAKETIGNDLLKGKTQIPSNATKESKCINNLNAKNQSNTTKENLPNVDVKNAAQPFSLNQSTASDHSISKIVTVDKGNKTLSSVDSGKQTKKVFGLIKRDTKPDVTSFSAENSAPVYKSKAEVESKKIENIVTKKDSQVDVSSKSDSTPGKVASNNLDPSKNKIRVFGVNKTTFRKDTSASENEILVTKSDENKVVSVPPLAQESPGKNFLNKTSEIKIASKKYDGDVTSNTAQSKAVSETSKHNIINKATESKGNRSPESSYVASKLINVSESSTLKDVDVTKVAEKSGEHRKSPSPPKDFRTVRRTSDVIAAKIQNIFSNISTPEKPPPLYAKKLQTQSKSSVNVDTNLANSGNKTALKSEEISKQFDGKQATEFNKNTSNFPSEVKVQNTDAVNSSKFSSVSKVQNIDVVNTSKFPPGSKIQNTDAVNASKFPSGSKVQNASKIGIQISSKRSQEDVNKEESKYKENAPSVADHSSLKKENKLASKSSDILRSCKTGEVVTSSKVETEVSLEKADSKTEHSINAASSKAEDKKNLNIRGKMPIKKEDQNSSDGTTSLKTPNQDDRKSSALTVPVKTVSENSNKASVLKTETPNTCVSSGEKIIKIVTSSNSLTSNNSSVDFKTNNINRNFENNISMKECISTKSYESHTSDKTSAVTKIVTSCVNAISQQNANDSQNISQKIVNNNKKSNQPNDASKIEVAKITPSTTSSAVPTVNVLFRTKSPQSSITKEENRKKVVVETYSNNSPVTSVVISASKISDNLSPSACDSVQEALKTVENVQKSVNSPLVQSKHSVVNLKKEELASVTLKGSISSVSENNMPPNTAKITDKCSSIEVNDDKIESDSTALKEKNPSSMISETVKTESVMTVASPKSDSLNGANSMTLERLDAGDKIEVIPYVTGKVKDEINDTSDNTGIGQKCPEMGKSSFFGNKGNVVDLNDWSKKFQLDEPEPPRVPLRRRTMRESMPPSLPVRSRFGSLKRIDDSPKYIARSPSQSSLPQRYSYTEMLSKVCSMGVLPYTESALSKSYSSSSSQVSELWSELSEEQSNATHTAEMLESETTERMRLEKEMQELQVRISFFLFFLNIYVV